MTGEAPRVVGAVPNVLFFENLGDQLVISRPIQLADGRPLVIDDETARPNGIDWSGRRLLDLLVRSSSGSVQVFPRELLRW